MGIGYLFVAAVALALLLTCSWTWEVPQQRRTEGRRAMMSLPGLSSTWKFSDSWAANATVITALFTGLFGAKEVTNTFLGQDRATNLLAVALVSAAISVGLAGLSPTVLQMFRKRFGEQPEVYPQPTPEVPEPGPIAGKTPAGLYVTPAGLLAAAVITLTATCGQFAAILFALVDTDFSENWVLYVIGAIAALVLAGYGWSSTRQNLTMGAKLPNPEETEQAGSDEAVAARQVLLEAATRGAQFQVDGAAIP